MRTQHNSKYRKAKLKPKKKRKRYTARQKLGMVKDVARAKGKGSPVRHRAVRAIAERTGVHESLLSKWLKASLVLLVMCLSGQGGNKAFVSPTIRRARFPQQEDELFEDFVFHREVEGRRIRGWWLRLRFWQILKRDRPPGWDRFGFSDG